ncbi:MAG: CoA transferase [Armatimonadota bacterium]|nr:CoA transferase [Armatimonadota bacterium]MDR7590261.1 CoA transferase [Armatimonadota bacterium]
MALPLEGLRVVDLSQGAAGPVCTQLLGDFGADVVKVEPPEGDWGRQLGPPFYPLPDGRKNAAAYVGMNRNKRSVVVDLKHPAGREAVLRLVDRADVFVESFRPGVAERLGLGAPTLLQRNPRLVYCSISAFGQHGPWRDRPGVDGVVQAMSGLMSVTGTEDGPPVKVGVPAADMVGGFLAATGILLALVGRQRTGTGQVVDLSLLDALLAFQTVPLAMYFCSGTPPPRSGSAAPYAAPNEAFPTRDGWVMVAAYSPERWERLCRVLGCPDLASDPRFATNDLRVRNRPALRGALEPLFRTRTTAQWVEALQAADILCAPLLTYPELADSPHVAERQMVVEIAHPQAGSARVAGIPIRLSHTPGRLSRPAPLPGEHTREVLREAGYTDEEVAELLRCGAVRAWTQPVEV